MCGIAGIIGRQEGLDPDAVKACLCHRGPDGFGQWSDDFAHFWHWRLSIIDLSPAGSQPMTSASGRMVICYNGEVYNCEDLRPAIEQEWANRHDRPLSWRGHSDTEVVLEGFELWGEAFLARLNGMFAFSIYDRAEKTVWLARDRAGIKPLYLLRQKGRIAFASEAKFFFNLPEFSPQVSPEGLAVYFTYGQGHGQDRMLAGVSKLGPGEVLKVACDPGGFGLIEERATRFAPEPRHTLKEWSEAEAAREIRRLLERSVRRQLAADVPVGVLLSGGVDSAILTTLTAKILGPENTHAFSLGYAGMGADFDELDQATATARALGVRHVVYQASATDFLARVEDLVWHYDEPFADPAALNVMVLCRSIRGRVTVALAGEGSDELFAGYRRYRVEQWLRRLGPLTTAAGWFSRRLRLANFPGTPRRAAILLRSLALPGAAERFSAYFEGPVPATELILPRWWSAADPRRVLKSFNPEDQRIPPVAAMCLTDQQFLLPDGYLEKSDKGSMAASLELRVPFLDDEVVAFANTLPDRLRVRPGQGKWLLKRAFADLVPQEVFTRFKRGFAAPVAQWLRGELKDYFGGRVLGSDARCREYLDTARVESLFQRHHSGAFDYSVALWRVLLFEIWLRRAEGRFARPAAGRPKRMNSPVQSHETRPAVGRPGARILVFISEDFYFLSHRRDLLMGLRNHGYEVVLATNIDDKRAEIEATGIPAIHLNLESRNLSIFTFLKKALAYHRIIKSTKPDLIFAVALKPVVTAAVAGCFCRTIPSLYAFAGLGVTFSSTRKSLRLRLVRQCFELTFGFLMNRPGRFCLFQNRDDLGLFLERRWTRADSSFVIEGSGVALRDFPEKCWDNKGPPRFIFAGRMTWEKGIRQLIEACRTLKAKNLAFECQIAGFFDKTGISTVPLDYIQRNHREGLIQWLGPRRDIPTLLSRADCFVFPSVYREGIPRVLLEACAAGIPSITTDNVGCRDVIEHEVDGLLVPPNDSRALADAMERVVRQPEFLPVWGVQARAKAVERFTVEGVIAAHLRVLEQILSGADRLE